MEEDKLSKVELNSTGSNDVIINDGNGHMIMREDSSVR